MTNEKWASSQRVVNEFLLLTSETYSGELPMLQSYIFFLIYYMPLPNIVELAKADLYTAKEELLKKYAQSQVDHLLRLRDMVTWNIANPDAKDRQFVDEVRTRYGLSLVTAYADLKIVKAILPNLSEASRDFHRWRYNEMILETYQMAKKRKDTKTMAKAATSYAKFNRIDIEDEQAVPYHMIVVQPFFPTTDPRVVGINPVPNIDERIRRLTRELSDSHPDTENIEYEEADLPLDEIFKEEQEDGQATTE